MPRPTELPVHVCSRCHVLWVGDSNMYEETDRCPRCGWYAGEPPWSGVVDDEFTWIGGGTSTRRLFLYSMTGGILRYQDGSFVQTTGALDEASYRR